MRAITVKNYCGGGIITNPHRLWSVDQWQKGGGDCWVWEFGDFGRLYDVDCRAIVDQWESNID